MNSSERTKFQTYVSSNMATLRAQLHIGLAVSSVGKRANFVDLRKALRSMGIAGTTVNVTEAAGMVGKKQKISNVDFALVQVPLEEVPEVDVAKEVKAIKDDVGHGVEFATLDGVAVAPAMYVQLDDAQMKHQPSSVPIGTRVKEGEKFGTYATKAWHEANTMLHMARWARDLTAMTEGKKVEHGQTERVLHPTVGPISYEGFCVLLGGKKYVSFHCYPNSR